MKLYFVMLLLVVSLFLTGCGTSGPKPPDPTMYTVGGTVTGLTGTGLVLQNNAGNNLTVSAKAKSFAFSTAVASGSAYKVSVLTQPSSPTQSCVVTGGSGTASGNVTNVSIACTTTTYTVGGSISNVVGSGLVLQDNGGDNLTVPAGATSFTFATPVAGGGNYAITVATSPATPTQSCVVTGGTGTVSGNVATVSIACTTLTYTVSGTISGLAGTGLVLQNNGSSLPVAAGATAFMFTAGVGEGLPYSVTVATPPSNPIQSCIVTNGSATSSVNVNNVGITCTTTTYTIGGTVSGLTGTPLVLQDNNGDNLTVTSNAAFAFATKLDSIATYNVTVLTQPINPPQSCAVTKGGGTASASVNVVVTCSNINAWAFENGSSMENQSGTYPSTAGNGGTNFVPGARYWGTSWSDTKGNFWLFGGYGFDSVGNGADLNDLWEGSFNSSGQWSWTWVGGDDMVGEGGAYTTAGTPNSGNFPGARDSAASWTDPLGNFWLFGGHGYDSTRTADNLNDLWEYSPATGEWTWVSGSDTVDQTGIYPTTAGTGGTGYVPGARYSAVSWIDKNRNVWLFGGMGLDSAGTVGPLNDLWEGNYNSSKQWIWTWVGGSNVAGVKGTYGTIGESGPLNTPGARYLSTSWTDAQGNLWLFGGYGLDGVSVLPFTAALSDLWEYNIGTGQWTWKGGYETAGWQGNYGTLGVPGPGNLGAANVGNIPGSRRGAVAWTDASGNFWLFGGFGFDSQNNRGQLNDLWQYNPTTGDWTWESGADTFGQVGCYQIVAGTCPTIYPGSRGGSANWIDSSGNLWLFGGNGPLSGVNGSFSDLWKYIP
jgi:hypothetical protein